MSTFENVVKTSVPTELQGEEYSSLIETAALQWSRVVAWTWTSSLAYAGEKRSPDEDNPKAKQEQELKTFLIQRLKGQAINTTVFVNCSKPQALTDAGTFSRDIRNLILGRNQAIEGFPSSITITLPEVIEKFTGNSFVWKDKTPEDIAFAEMFIIRVDLDSFSGKIAYVDGETQNTPPKKDKYILYLPYPPRPVFSEATITELELSDWVNKLSGVSYTPDSAYLPWCLC